MTDTRAHFAKALARTRAAARLSRCELAADAGISERMVYLYEAGEHGPTPRRLRQLADALECEPGELTGVVRGEESLRDLRYAAGLSLAEVAEALRSDFADIGLHLTPRTLSAAESGILVPAQGWDDGAALGRLVVALGGLYGTPTRMVLDAWMRSRPGDVTPHIPGTGAPHLSKAAMVAWQHLNKRQQDYLAEIYAEEQAVEHERRQARANGSREPSRGWRRLTLAYRGEAEGLSHTRLQQRLIERGVHDPGTGSTIHALAKRDLVTVTEEEMQHPLGGTLIRIAVELTRRGRAAVRAGTGAPDAAPPGHLLSEWLWGVVARVARSEPVGLPENDLAGRSLFFIGVGYKHRAGGRPSRGFIDAVPVHAPGDTHVLEYRWRLTRLGRRHVAEYLATYQELYPGEETAGLEEIADTRG
ncbi:helix-turn-helix domain-containing protein [Antribacter sp. KLBMP9083]|uniref:Helix-turn-helix domain-containing protein n=1 Tax=Antribacter soli TaxID=2910976 RepID=A0AA41QH65_9MICO|nr:helix-turn-helix transcriptional regulator [Antribacter soli]MCF4123026.1 helix-turn-helix domain-containing protein [Antribacter soli]